MEDLINKTREIRRHILNMTADANSGHPGGSLSAVEILTVLYFQLLNIKSDDPYWEDRDRFILSKSHACPVLYATLCEAGFFPKSELKSFRSINGILQGHAHIKTPGVDMSGGSLGQGLSFGVGVALSAKLDDKNYRTYVLLGDGECDEGQIWEAAMSANHYNLNNLIAIVDRNRIQNDRWTHQVMDIEPFKDKWEAFGWNVIDLDGHNIEELIKGFKIALDSNNKPTVIIANTIKGKGVSFMENNPDFHGKAPNQEQLINALSEIDSH
ncbi:MAG: transketolase [Chloroflexi bacterium]|nr:transketolase [Chloroflexota bacterium]|tara:strand:+ start:91 stop:897 length:807 start_codon:yes stop_codon:yes gene_type:complete